MVDGRTIFLHVLWCDVVENVYLVRMAEQIQAYSASLELRVSKAPLSLWHRSLGHANNEAIKEARTRTRGLEITVNAMIMRLFNVSWP